MNLRIKRQIIMQEYLKWIKERNVDFKEDNSEHYNNN